MISQTRIEQLLEAWVNQNSHTQNHAGVRMILESFAHELAVCGMKVEWIDSIDTNQGQPPALLATLGATTATSSPVSTAAHAPTFTFVSHADTVFPIDSPFQKIKWSADRKIAIGPGVIDDKGGMLVILAAISELASLADRPFSLQVICMPGEETGSSGFHSFLKKISASSDVVLGFEPSLPDGSIIHSRRGNRWYEIKMSGPGGHAGRDAGRVVNPLTEISSKLAEMAKLTDVSRGVSVTPGSLQTNTTGFNSIPAEVTARVDVRFDANSDRDALHARLLPLLAGTEWNCVEDCPAMSLNAESEAQAKTMLACITHEEGRSVSVVKATGSSDSNYLYRSGIPFIDGLGPCGNGLHSEQETLEVSTIGSRARAVAKWVKNYI